jgi:NAD(P)-dependent dehydrogenase (short-subunit alcohol dehydrogenase family)
MGSLDGRVAVITGAGRGLGREHALLFAREGARVVVNDLGTSDSGEGSDRSAADEAVELIRAEGGEAIANTDDVSTWDGAERLIGAAIDAYGELDILVNNAGILRDRAVVTMSEVDWDHVIAVHLKGHFAPTRFAAAYWRAQHKAGLGRPRNIVNTSSTSGLFANPGQSNYGAAKSGIATFSQIVAKELAKYDVRTNCIAPAARTRLTLAAPGLEDLMRPAAGAFDEWHPANISPVVAYLASQTCTFNGETFYVHGGTVTRMQAWVSGPSVHRDDAWTVEALAEAVAALAAD